MTVTVASGASPPGGELVVGVKLKGYFVELGCGRSYGSDESGNGKHTDSNQSLADFDGSFGVIHSTISSILFCRS
jgi:hypothetical protein